MDIIINSKLSLNTPPVKNLAELLFRKLDKRDEYSQIILSHIDDEIVTVSLDQLKAISSKLYKKFDALDIKSGDTVLLGSLAGNNELYIALLFLSLSSYGVRVFLPMFVENSLLKEWLNETKFNKIIASETELNKLNHHEKERRSLRQLKDFSVNEQIPFIDILSDLNLEELIREQSQDVDSTKVDQVINNTSLEQESLIITTSGTTGKSKLVVYRQESFVKSCMSWDIGGLFNADKLGGRGFTPLFTHTMGIRGFFNALWTGHPVCLIKTDWFQEKPETVSYFLRKMKPEHITGGPAVFNLFLELVRNFPELADLSLKSFKTLVASGASFSPEFDLLIQKHFGIKPQNAFGTTETQQVLSTMMNAVSANNNYDDLGDPLPGVTVKLSPLESDDQIFQLSIKTPFGCSTILNESNCFDSEGYFNTGDLVSYEDGKISYLGRENVDFIKDQFGVKIPLNAVRNYYSPLGEKVDHIELFPIKDRPGLGAIIFINRPEETDSVVLNASIKESFKSLIQTINNQLNDAIEPFEYNHRSIKRLIIVNSSVPRTAKGNASRHQIIESYQSYIKELTDPMSSKLYVINLEHEHEYHDSFTRFNNPHIGQLLHTLGLDYSYHRSESDFLYTYIKGKEKKILDLTGGYGTNLIGHNHPEIKKAIMDYIQTNEVAISDQGSLQKHPGNLARKLNQILANTTQQDYNVLFGNSGSEAVEMALQHALFAWKENIKKLKQEQFQIHGGNCSQLLSEVWRKNEELLSNIHCRVIALSKGFHGNSSGARSVLGNDKKREPFRNILGINPLFLNDIAQNWEEQLEILLKQNNIKLTRVVYKDGVYTTESFEQSLIIAAIAEPIIGEGGVRVVKHKVLEALSSITPPLILDQIQCGLGRSGDIITAPEIKADYYLFGKALGGGYSKISAVCINNKIYVKKFGEYYVSTFANGGLACKVALDTLSLIEQDDLPQEASKKGSYFKERLLELCEKYPAVIDRIEGKGLMLGIYFKDFSNSLHILLRNLYEQDKLGYIFTAYLHNGHGIRIFPTLSAPNTLRIEPSAYIAETAIDYVINAFDNLCQLIIEKDFYSLVKNLMNDDPYLDRETFPENIIPTVLEEPLPESTKVAFVAHYTHPIADMKMTIPELNQASDTGLRILFNKMQVLMEMKPFLLFSKNIMGGKINFNFIIIPLDSAQMESMHKRNKRLEIVGHIQEAVNLAHKMDAKVISLGAYTSILSDNGMSIVEPEGTKVITGNTLTVATGIRHLFNNISNVFDELSNLHIAIVGSSGNIGSAITESIVNRNTFNKITIIGRNERKLQRQLQQLKQNFDRVNNVQVSTDFEALKECDVIIIATNASDPIIFEHHINKEKTVLISDVSVPPAVHKAVKEFPNVKYLSFSSYIQLPQDPEFMMSSITPPGSVFCCSAEAILCGLEEIPLELKGTITQEAVNTIMETAESHGLFQNVISGKSYKTTHA